MKKASFLSVLSAFVLPFSAVGQAVIGTQDTVRMGVDSSANLILYGGPQASIGGEVWLGVRYHPNGFGAAGVEGMGNGQFLEGWGAGDALSGASLYFNNGSAESGYLNSFSNPAADRAVSITRDVTGALRVTHDFHSSDSIHLFEVDIKIENTSSHPQQIVYRRSSDWNVEPWPLSEYLTSGGYSGSAQGALQYFTNHGRAASDPFAGESGLNGPFANSGPVNQGTLFQFDFGTVQPGQSVSFRMFMGGAANQASALSALKSVDAEVYAMMNSALDPQGVSTTFMIGFDGVGLPSPFPQPVPEASTWLGGLALGILAVRRLRRSL